MRSSVVTLGVLTAVFAGCLQEQEPPAPNGKEAQPIPPRASPADYQAQGQTGVVALGAEFTGHFVVMPEGTLSTEDYVVVETGIFGPAGTRLILSTEDFSLRINGKKSATPSRPYGMVVENLKDPDWEAPAPKDPNKPKTTIGSSGRNSQAEPGSPPPVVHIPIEVQRAMAQRVQKASLPEGDRVLPQAGLLFFEYKGKAKSIHSLELIYNGPAGKASFELRP